MSDRSVLVTAVSGNIGNNIVRILLENDYIVYACDINKYVPCMENVVEFSRCPSAHEDTYIDFLIGCLVSNDIKILIPVNEQEISVINSNRDRFDECGVRIAIQSKDVLSICLDKHKTMRYLEGNGILVPKTYKVSDSFEPEKRYIVKKRKSNGSKDVMPVRGCDINVVELRSDDYIVQDYIEGEEYSVGVFRNNNDTRIICLKRELFNGYSNIVRKVFDENINRIATEVADLFNLEGFINVQLRLTDDDRIYIFEINPRISGTVYFRHLYGYEDVLWWLQTIDNKKLPDYIEKNTDKIGIRELREQMIFGQE